MNYSFIPFSQLGDLTTTAEMICEDRSDMTAIAAGPHHLGFVRGSIAQLKKSQVIAYGRGNYFSAKEAKMLAKTFTTVQGSNPNAVDNLCRQPNLSIVHCHETSVRVIHNYESYDAYIVSYAGESMVTTDKVLVQLILETFPTGVNVRKVKKHKVIEITQIEEKNSFEIIMG